MAKGAGTTYAAYAGAAKKASKGADPSLQNIGADRISAILSAALGRMPAVQTPEQIAAQAAGFVTPQIQSQIDALKSDIDARVSRGQTDITNYTNAAQRELGNVPGKVANVYGAAEQARAAVEKALEGDSAAAAPSITGELGAKLRAIQSGTDNGESMVNDAAGLGGNITGGVKLRGATDLNRLIGEAKAEGTFALEQPGLIGQQGSTTSRLFGEQGLADFASGAKSIRDAAPGQIAQLAERLTEADSGNRADRAKLYTSLYGDLLNLNTQRGIARQGYGLDVAKIGAGVDATNARIEAASKTAAAKAKTANAKAYNTALTKAQEHLNSLHGAFTQGVATHATQPKTDAFGKVVTGPDGNPILTSTTVYQRLPYYQAIRMAEQAITPYLGPYATAADIVRMAQQYVNPLYPAGKFGRPGAGPGPGTAAPPAQTKHRHRG